MILSIDPGIRGCGVAVFSDRYQELSVLLYAAYVKNEMAEGSGPGACAKMAGSVRRQLGERCDLGIQHYSALVLEWPQVYTDKRQWKGDPNDLLPLAGVDAAITALMNTNTKHYLPREWKGQAPKEVIATRALSRLSEGEKAAIQKTTKSLIHNVYDAVALGLYHLGRLDAERVIPR